MNQTAYGNKLLFKMINSIASTYTAKKQQFADNPGFTDWKFSLLYCLLLC